MGGGQGRGRQRLRIGRKNGEGSRKKNTRRFSRNITVDFISCSNVNDVYDGPEILTYRNISLSLSLFEGIPARRFRFGWERMERVIVSFWWKKDKRVWLILSVLRAFELKFQGWMSSRLKSTSEERKVLENMWLMRRIFLFFFFLFLRTSPWFIDERSLLNFNTNLDVKEGGRG